MYMARLVVMIVVMVLIGIVVVVVLVNGLAGKRAAVFMHAVVRRVAVRTTIHA